MEQSYKKNLINTFIIIASIIFLLGFLNFLYSGTTMFVNRMALSAGVDSLQNYYVVLSGFMLTLSFCFLALLIAVILRYFLKDKIKVFNLICFIAGVFTTVVLLAFFITNGVIMPSLSADAGMQSSILLYFVVCVVYTTCFGFILFDKLCASQTNESGDLVLEQVKSEKPKKAEVSKEVKIEKQKRRISKLFISLTVLCCAICVAATSLLIYSFTTSNYTKSLYNFYYNSEIITEESSSALNIKITNNSNKDYMDTSFKVIYTTDGVDNQEAILQLSINKNSEDTSLVAIVSGFENSSSIISVSYAEDGINYISLPFEKHTKEYFTIKEYALLIVAILSLGGAIALGVISSKKSKQLKCSTKNNLETEN